MNEASEGDRVPVGTLRSMQMDAIRAKEARGLKLSRDEIVYLYALICSEAHRKVKATMRQQADPRKAIEQGMKVLLGEIGGTLCLAAKKQNELEVRIAELESRVPKPRTRVKARGVPA